MDSGTSKNATEESGSSRPHQSPTGGINSPTPDKKSEGSGVSGNNNVVHHGNASASGGGVVNYGKISKIYIASTPVEDVSELDKWLKPVDFTDKMDFYRQNFVPETRQSLLKEIIDWIEKKDASSGAVLWIKGEAGVGKSMLSWIVSNNIPESIVLGAMFFCEFNNVNRSRADQVILTVAAKLAKKIPEYAEFLAKKRNQDSVSEKKLLQETDISKLFDELILEGLRGITFDKTIVIIIDALDECTLCIGKHDTYQNLLDLLARLSGDSKLTFLKIIVSARPENAIFERLRNCAIVDIQSSKSSRENFDDIVKFVSGCLRRKFGTNDNRLSQTSRELARKAEGVFLYARLACDQISSQLSKRFDKAAEMQVVEDIVRNLKYGVDNLYEIELLNVIKMSQNGELEGCEDFNSIENILGIICCVREPLSQVGIADLLDCRERAVEAVVNALRKILNIGKVVTVVHKSLSDYLTRSQSNTPLTIGLNIETTLAIRSLQVLNQELKFNILDLPQDDLYRWHQDIPDFEQRVNSIPDHLRYAGLYATSHLALVKEAPTGIIETIDEIVSTKLLYWMELLSVLSQFSDFVGVSAALLAWCSRNNGLSKTLTLRLLSDAKRVCAQFGVPISVCALQVYWSALPFSPVNSTFHQTFASAKWRPKGKYPALLQTQGIATQWSPCLCTCVGHTKYVTAVAISNDGDRIVSGSWDKTVKIWDANTGKEIRTLTGHTSTVNAVAISNDGKRIVSGSYDNAVKIWNANTGKEIRTLTGHTDFVILVAISNDGDRIVSGSWDDTVKIWNANTGKEIRTLTGHTTPLDAVAISDDGRYILSKSPGESFVWSMETGEQQNATKFIGSSSKEASRFTIDSGWVKENEELRFWIPSELRGKTVISDTRIVSFPPPVDGYVTAAFIDVSFG